MTDLSFARFAHHRAVVEQLLADARADPQVIGLHLAGSVARADALAGSDVDVQMLLRDGAERPLHVEMRDGVLVEVHHADEARVRAKLLETPSYAYAYTDGRALWDPQGALARIRSLGEEVLGKWQPTEQQRRDVTHLMQSARQKLAAVAPTGDDLRLGMVLLSTPAILEALWMVNGLPLPAQGAILAHRADLRARPPSFEQLLADLVTGTPAVRAGAASTLVSWVLERLMPVA